MSASASAHAKPETIVIEDFKCSGGKHCWTTALKGLLDYHGLRLSEEMLFGLGGGVGFIYWYMKFMPAPIIGTRYGKGTDPLIKTCERIGAEASIVETASESKGYEELKRLLREGEPAFTFVDMAYLPYLVIPEQAHFGGHTVVVFGVDEVKEKAYLCDRAKKPVTVRIEDLGKARSSRFPPFSPKNKLLKVKYPRRLGGLEDGIRDSIWDCCNAMLTPPIKNIGLDGIRKWASIVPTWPAHFKGMELLGCLFNVFMYIEISGTGGSAFRTMYADFLSEAASVLKKPALREISEMFRESAKLWSTVAQAALPDSWPSLSAIRELSSQKNNVFENQEGDAFKRMREITVELDAQMKEAAAELDRGDTAGLLSELQNNILKCYPAEKRALETLAAAIE